MTRKEYRFNEDTLSYEEVKAPFRMRLYRLLRKGIVIFIFASAISLLFSLLFVTPKMRRMEDEKEELLMKYAILNDKIDLASRRVEELKYRDNHVYRTLFGVDSLRMAGIYNPYPPERYAYLENDPYTPVMMKSWMSLDAVTRQVYLRSRSLDEIQALSMNKEEMALFIPAIWPIDKRDLKSSIGAFNPRRYHPILKRVRPHNGIDLETNRGDPVYATGNGTVESVTYSRARIGYGNQILIDHGYGYKTRYAHLTSIFVEEGQQIKRGENIGTVGSTGRSTGPHLHYEVIYLGRHVDPIMYFRRDMSEEDFQRVIESVSDKTFETDD